MTNKRTFIFLSLSYIMAIILILEIITAPSENHYKETRQMLPTNFDNTHLLSQIEMYAEKQNSPPVDAVIDPVWKLVPGYNGLNVNVEESYLNMFPSTTFDERFIVYEEELPKIHFSELAPAPIYKGNPEKPMIAFLINVAWGDEFIPPILKTLEKHHVKATFFFDGSWVKKNPELAKFIAKNSHEIGNHAYSHPDLKTFSSKQTKEELEKTNQVIKETLSITPKWFAPPSGSFKDETVQIAHDLDMYTILWTVDTIDWRNPEVTSMVNRVVSEVHNGAMILMHPTKATAGGLEQMIQLIQEKGLAIGTVSELFDEKRVIQK